MITSRWNLTAKTPVPLPLPSRGRLPATSEAEDAPAPVDFTASAGRCEPIEGEAYDQVPTERVGVTPAWKVEEPVYFGATTEQVRAVLEPDDAAPCAVCPLRTAA